MNNRKKIEKSIIEWVGGGFIFLSMISISLLIISNSLFIYQLVIDYYELPYITGITRKALLANYHEIVKYLQFPWIQELYMPDFPMSQEGRIHFEEVKKIFQTFNLIFVIFLMSWLIALIKKIKIFSIFEKAANLVFISSGLIAIFIMFDFNEAFVVFHKIFFNNDYWIFHPSTDPIILALPEELFMILGLGLLFVLVIQALLIKFIGFKKKKKSPSNF